MRIVVQNTKSRIFGKLSKQLVAKIDDVTSYKVPGSTQTNTETAKRCARCKKVKPLAEFYNCNSRKGAKFDD